MVRYVMGRPTDDFQHPDTLAHDIQRIIKKMNCIRSCTLFGRFAMPLLWRDQGDMYHGSIC
jgi:hypothetical protein